MMTKLHRLPIVLVAILVVVMFLLDSLGIGYKLLTGWNTLFALLIFTFGTSILAIGGYSFRKANTTVNPLIPDNSSHLVTHGLYRYSRNPMYIGFLLWLLACAVYIGNVLNFLLIPLFVILANMLYIRPEEKALERLFTSDYLEYKRNVRRWL